MTKEIDVVLVVRKGCETKDRSHCFELLGCNYFTYFIFFLKTFKIIGRIYAR